MTLTYLNSNDTYPNFKEFGISIHPKDKEGIVISSDKRILSFGKNRFSEYDETTNKYTDITDKKLDNFTGVLISYNTTTRNFENYRGRQWQTYSYTSVYCSIMRFLNGEKHCTYAPAFQEFYGNMNFSNDDQDYLKNTNKWFLYGKSLTKEVWSKAIKNNLFSQEKITKLRTNRIKLNGHLVLGEQLEAFGNGNLLWIRSGVEYLVLAKEFRRSAVDSRIITKQKQVFAHQYGTSDKETRECSMEEMEEMFTDNLSILLRSVTPT